jgi:predicted dehydrogenase
VDGLGDSFHTEADALFCDGVVVLLVCWSEDEFMKLRLGVVGIGADWETRHRLALRSLGDRFEVRAVCTEVAQRAEQMAREWGAVAVDSYRSLAARSDIDALLLFPSNWFGVLPILAACDAGKAVYCGAVLDVPTERAREIKRRVEDAGIAFMAEFPRRHSPATLRLKELIATRLGQPRLLYCHMRRSAKSDPREESHAITREMIELIDWCRYVVGSDPSAVWSTCHQGLATNRVDYEMMSLDFSPPGSFGVGALAQISCGQYLPNNWSEAASFRRPAAMQVACQKGVAFLDLPATLTWFDEAGRHTESLESERPVGEQLLTHFHRAVTSLVRRTSDLEDAYRALHVVCSGRESFATGRRVAIEF